MDNSPSILYKKFACKIMRTKKKFTKNLKSPSIFHRKIVKLGTIFEKKVCLKGILKINGATPQLDQNLKPK